MKEAATLLLVLMMGWFASQAFGFSLSPERSVEEQLYQEVDTLYEQNPARLTTIAGKLPTLKRYFVDNPADIALLENLHTYIDYKLNEPTDSDLSPSIASTLSKLFD